MKGKIIARITAVLTVIAFSASSLGVLAFADGFDVSAFTSDTVVTIVAVSVGIGLIAVFVMKSTMKRTQGSGSASSYLDRSSVKIYRTRDRYLYSTVTKIKKADDNDKRR